MTTPSYDSLRQLFRQPPLDYSDFVTWFWETGELEKERITWQLEELKKKGVGGTWYYPRYLDGERYGTDPAYFSEEWWEFFRHSVAEHERLGLEAWFSGWEGREYWQDLLRAERAARPELHGRRLVIHEARSQEEGTLQLDLPQGETVLAAAAFRIEDGGLDPDSSRKLALPEPGQPLAWDAPEPGWLLAAVASQPHDLDYLNPHVAARYLEIYWQEHEERLRDFVPGTLSLYGQDELYVLNGKILYAPELAARFRAEKGYDPAPHLFGLFHDIGDFTDKIRCDYYEVMSALLEENLYRPLCEWHEERGMRYGTIATWGRQDMLGQTWHYGDFFRLMRWLHVTGNEDPGASLPGERCFIDAKLSSSVQHIYRRERAAMCVYWGSGWGMTQEQNIAWTNENYAYGLNLYNQHGGLYNTLGGWYEWVPPSVHWRQPYWEHWQTFVDYVSRLSAVMSQGTHVADAALLYPLTTVHANWLRGDSFTSAADDCAMTTFSLARQVYGAGIDFDFVDDNLLSEAVVRDGTLEIAGIRFRAVILPPITTIRRQTLAKLLEFYDGGGTVVAFRRLPGASQEHGRNDPQVRAALRHIFGIASSEEAVHRTEVHSQALGSIYRQHNEHGGQGFFLPGQETARTPHAAQRGVDIAAVISDAIDRDVVVSGRNVFHTHQRIGDLDVYFLYNVESVRRELTLALRVRGEPEIWDCWNGEVTPWHRFSHTDDRTTVRLTMEANQGIVLVMRPPAGRPAVTADNLGAITHVETAGDTVEIRGTIEEGGGKTVRVRHGGREYGAQARFGPAQAPMHLTGDWSFRLTPTMDNRWGDFRDPAGDEKIGAEARQFRYREEETAGEALGWHSRDYDDGGWPVFTYTFGPYWRASGPFPRGRVPPELAALAAGDADALNAGEIGWQTVCFSQEFGQPGSDVFGGSHGVGDSFLCLDVADEHEESVRYLYTHVRAPRAGRWNLHLGADSGQVEQAWLNGEALQPDSSGEPVQAETEVFLQEGLNLLLLACVQPPAQPLRAYAALLEQSTTPVRDRPAARLTWFAEPSELVYETAPHKERRVGWYRCEAPAGTHTLHLDVDGESVQVWVNGAETADRDGQFQLDAPLADVSQIALRVEQKPGVYAGAAIRQPVRFECADASLPLGDWSQYALESYSGGAVYKKKFTLKENQLRDEVVLDLGAVNTTAEVAVNGQVVGVRLARPYRFDITGQVHEGENELEVTVYNTLANYFSTGPYESDYVFPGQTVSGLLGPVTVSFPARVMLTARPVWNTRL
ncbi:MAG: glycosyl hydrolase [Caldilineaceae bacterium]|nr:glycosyl hydrolase [Caldilineaceae bacterium]